MLNTKYLIVNPDGAPVQDPNPLGNAWFVDNFQIVENADAEIDALKGFDPSATAVVDQRYKAYIEGKSFNKNGGTIMLTEYEPNYLKYEFNSNSEQLTVFSEIFYNKGWDAFIDGEKVPHFRVDYLLRAMIIPKGEHTIEFKFEPQSYYLGNKISYAGSIFFILLVMTYLFLLLKKRGISLQKGKDNP
jgi:hypothetical protein